MAKRKSAEQPEIVQQLRPDDTGWLAELRRARTEPISLAPGPDDDLAQLSDPSAPATSERTEPPHELAEPPQPDGIDPSPSEGTGPTASERTGPAPEADPTPSPRADPTPSPEDDLTPSPGTDPTPSAEGGTSAPPPQRDALPPPLLAPPAAPPHRPPSDLGVQRSIPPPATWYRPTRPPARSAPLRPTPSRPLVAAPHHVDVPLEPTPRQTRRARGRGRRRNDKRHRSLLRRWDVVLPLLALVVGATIGLTWRGTGTPSSGQPVGGPGSAASLPSSSPTELPESIVVTSIRYVGDSITLSWIDPTEGQALFVISQIISDDTDARFVRDLPAGQTEAVITGLDPNVSEYCYRVFAVQNGGAVARSATTCAQKRNPA